MEILKTALFILAIIVAFMFTVLVFTTGKGDAMSGGSAVRTTFKGKASFDDIVSKITFILGISFMALMLALDVIGYRLKDKKATVPPPTPPGILLPF